MYKLANTAWDDEELEAIKSVVDSNRYSMGECVSEFETTFSDLVSSKYCVMVNSGSSANLLAIAALFYRSENQLKAGDEVIVPAVSWSTTYYPLQQYGLKIKFVDIDNETLNYSLSELESAITEKTRLIVAVNLLGNPNDFQKINHLIENTDIILFEDNCESLGATFSDKSAGTFGLLGSFSTYFSHHISTMEGGMVITDDEELYHIMLSLRSHGWTRHLPFDNKVCTKSTNDFEESFKFVLPGYNLRPLEMSGAIGLKQIKKIPEIIEGRRANARTFIDVFSNIDGVTIQKELGASSWFGFSMVFEEGKEARRKIIEVFDANGVECRPIVAGNFTKNPVVKFLDYSIHGTLANANAIDEGGLFIGNHHYDVSSELENVGELVLNNLR